MKKYYTINEVARILRMKSIRIYNIIIRKEMKCIILNNRLLIEKNELDRFIK